MMTTSVDPCPQVTVCYAMEILASNALENSRAFGELGACEAVTRTLAGFKDDPEVQVRGICAASERWKVVMIICNGRNRHVFMQSWSECQCPGPSTTWCELIRWLTRVCGAAQDRALGCMEVLAADCFENADKLREAGAVTLIREAVAATGPESDERARANALIECVMLPKKIRDSTRIQSAVRQKLARKTLRGLQENKAATTIQSVMRMKKGQEELKRLKAKRDDAAATKLQSRARILQAKKVKKGLEEQKRNAAATEIQALYRGHRGRLAAAKCMFDRVVSLAIRMQKVSRWRLGKIRKECRKGIGCLAHVLALAAEPCTLQSR
jgi:hypothetical protein